MERSHGVGTTFWQHLSQAAHGAQQGALRLGTSVVNLQQYIPAIPLLGTIKNAAQSLRPAQGTAASSFIQTIMLPVEKLATGAVQTCVYTKNMALKLTFKSVLYFFPNRFHHYVTDLHDFIAQNPALSKLFAEISPKLVENYGRYRLGLPIDMPPETASKFLEILQSYARHIAAKCKKPEDKEKYQLIADLLSSDSLREELSKIAAPLLQLVCDFQTDKPLKISPVIMQHILQAGIIACQHAQDIETIKPGTKNWLKLCAKVLENEGTMQQLTIELAALTECALPIIREGVQAASLESKIFGQGLPCSLATLLTYEKLSKALWPHIPRIFDINLDILERMLGSLAYVQALRDDFKNNSWPQEPQNLFLFQTWLDLFARYAPAYQQVMVNSKENYFQFCEALENYLDEAEVNLSQDVIMRAWKEEVKKLRQDPQRAEKLLTSFQHFTAFRQNGALPPVGSIPALLSAIFSEMHDFFMQEAEAAQAGAVTNLGADSNNWLAKSAFGFQQAFSESSPEWEAYLEQQIAPFFLAANYQPFDSKYSLSELAAISKLSFTEIWNKKGDNFFDEYFDEWYRLIDYTGISFPNIFAGTAFFVHYGSSAFTQIIDMLAQARNDMEGAAMASLNNIFKNIETALLPADKKHAPRFVNLVKNSLKLLQLEVSEPLLLPGLKVLLEGIGKIALDNAFRFSDEELNQIVNAFLGTRRRLGLPDLLITEEQFKQDVAVFCHQVIPHHINEAVKGKAALQITDREQIRAALHLIGFAGQVFSKLRGDVKGYIAFEECYSETQANLSFDELNSESLEEFIGNCVKIAKIRIAQTKPRMEKILDSILKELLREFVNSKSPEANLEDEFSNPSPETKQKIIETYKRIIIQSPLNPLQAAVLDKDLALINPSTFAQKVDEYLANEENQTSLLQRLQRQHQLQA